MRQCLSSESASVRAPAPPQRWEAWTTCSAPLYLAANISSVFSRSLIALILASRCLLTPFHFTEAPRPERKSLSGASLKRVPARVEVRRNVLASSPALEQRPRPRPAACIEK